VCVSKNYHKVGARITTNIKVRVSNNCHKAVARKLLHTSSKNNASRVSIKKYRMLAFFSCLSVSKNRHKVVARVTTYIKVHVSKNCHNVVARKLLHGSSKNYVSLVSIKKYRMVAIFSCLSVSKNCQKVVARVTTYIKVRISKISHVVALSKSR